MVRQLCPCSPGRPQGAQTHWQPVEEPTPQRSATWWKWSSPLNLPDPDQDLPEAERPSKVSAKHVLGKSFWELNLQDPHDMVVTLLHHAPSCNRDAATIWREIIPNGETAEKVLRELLLVLQDWPLHSTCTSDGGRKDAFALAATRALLEIICKPEYFINVSDHFPQLFLALIFQIFSSTEELPEDLDTLWQGHQQEDCLPTAPSRVALQVEEQGGWEGLLNPEARLCMKGLLAREMHGIGESFLYDIAQSLVELLSREQPCWELPAMAFLAELQAFPDMRALHNCFLQLAPRTPAVCSCSPFSSSSV
ncbi:uncharacterized protein LOC133628955 isoform X2 [Colius striatus]|uniref:uncharacterized protein LOC133628955 isoform X2 n=1 Tax=Colius striatus TaxID=57412 RepID=UPI002B1D1819|nr:uncharacterized protein LOC133628955 isoform X2 [Colius striatus]